MEYQWIIRPAQQSDYRAARMLLPNAVHFGSGCIVLIGESSDDHHVIAAAALSARLRNLPVPGARVDVHVIPPWRKYGIARALIEQMTHVARNLGAKAIFAFNPIPIGSEIEKCWRALGFLRANPVEIGIGDLRQGEAYLKPIYEQVVEHGWIPEQAKLIPLRKADHLQIANLHAQHLGGTAAEVLQKLRGESPDAIDLDISPVLVLDGVVKGFSLGRFVGKNLHVDATVVDPTLRGGWANLMLKFLGGQWALAAGATHIVFETYERHSDTRKLFRQIGGVRKSLIEPYRLLDGSSACESSPAARVSDAPPPGANRRED